MDPLAVSNAQLEAADSLVSRPTYPFTNDAPPTNRTRLGAPAPR